MKRFIGRKLGQRLIVFFGSITVLLLIFGIYVFYFSNSELLPYVGLMAFSTSTIPMILIVGVHFFMKK